VLNLEFDAMIHQDLGISSDLVCVTDIPTLDEYTKALRIVHALEDQDRDKGRYPRWKYGKTYIVWVENRREEDKLDPSEEWLDTPRSAKDPVQNIGELSA
jgi:hypothetical protein